jgi:hypothetical protein
VGLPLHFKWHVPLALATCVAYSVALAPKACIAFARCAPGDCCLKFIQQRQRQQGTLDGKVARRWLLDCA